MALNASSVCADVVRMAVGWLLRFVDGARELAQDKKLYSEAVFRSYVSNLVTHSVWTSVLTRD